jgi:hypothetical protein
MKATGSKANPAAVNEIFAAEIASGGLARKPCDLIREVHELMG